MRNVSLPDFGLPLNAPIDTLHYADAMVTNRSSPGPYTIKYISARDLATSMPAERGGVLDLLPPV